MKLFNVTVFHHLSSPTKSSRALARVNYPTDPICINATVITTVYRFPLLYIKKNKNKNTWYSYLLCFLKGNIYPHSLLSLFSLVSQPNFYIHLFSCSNRSFQTWVLQQESNWGKFSFYIWKQLHFTQLWNNNVDWA